MTVHGAKGLQAPVVILPDTPRALKTSARAIHLLDGGLPVWSPKFDTDTETIAMARAAEKAKDLREHRRLLYVALTRAQRTQLHGQGVRARARHLEMERNRARVPR